MIDYDFLIKLDTHCDPEVLKLKIENKDIIVYEADHEIKAWLRFNYFWDEIPFMNLLFVLDGYRRKGIGKKLVSFWESEMQDFGHDRVMTSTLINEEGKFFYEGLDYEKMGSFQMKDDDEELIYIKYL
jgi:GNAT superfamily N-acetyltransferase